MKKNITLALTAFTCSGLSYAQTANQPANPKQYNVLFIASDDLSNAMQSFNNPKVKTPNLERLAQRGVVFNYAHNQYPLSGPSRACIMTGLRPEKTRVFDLETSFRQTVPEAKTLPQLFKEHGYYTARAGKIFHAGVPSDIGQNGSDDAQSWDVRYNPIGRDRTEEHLVTNYTPNRVFKGNLGSTLSFMSMDATDAEMTDGMVANTAVKLMRDLISYQSKPFFIAAGFYRPHCPYIAPKKYFDLYPISEVELPEQRADDWDNKPDAAKFTDPLNWGMTEEQQRNVIQAYYASISFMDAQVGVLLDGLDELGIADNTIIVFWSDHGYNTGHHGQWMKKTLFDQTTRTPLIISIPGMNGNGKKVNSHVEMIDIYPTVANACGVTPSSIYQGVDLKPVLENVDAEWDRPAYTMVMREERAKDRSLIRVFYGKTVRYQNWRYTEWDNGKEGYELYNYATDPLEFENLANDKKYKKEVARLKELLYKNQ